MSYFITTVREFIFGRSNAVEVDPVYRFFFETKSQDRKKVYIRALKKAQLDQEKISQSASRKIRA